MTLRRLGGVGLVVLVALVGLAAFSGSAAADAPTCTGTGTDFAGGDGTFGDPYQIENVSHLQCMNHTAHLDEDFVLTDDVDASDTENWNGGAGFAPIGNDTDWFDGSFDGQGHTISNLTIDRSSEDYVGLFGYMIGSVEEVVLSNVSVTGNDNVGGLAGHSDASVTNASVNGTVSGVDNVGGLVGEGGSGSTITDSSVHGTVEGTNHYVGGLVGYNTGSVTGSYVTGTVDGNHFAGGLLGHHGGGSVTDSYATATVTAPGNYKAGLIAELDGTPALNQGTVTNSYATGAVTDDSTAGGLVGTNNDGTVSDSYWDVNSTGQTTSDGNATGLTTEEMTGVAALTNMSGFDFDDTWAVTNDYPELRHDHTHDMAGTGTDATPFVVTNVDELQAMEDALDAHYELGNDVDASATAGWNAGDGFDPVGEDGDEFVGSFDGLGHTVSNLTVDRAGENDVGLFGLVEAGGSVSNVTLGNVSVNGRFDTGGLVGDNRGTATNASTSGAVSGDSFVGGLVGFNSASTVENSSATVTVSSTGSHVGGLVGQNFDGSVANSSASGTVTGTAGEFRIGGLVGSNTGSVSDSSATGNVSGDGIVGGVVGDNDGTITASTAMGTVDGTGNTVGGLVGFNTGSVSESTARGNVSGDGFVGGLVGENDGGDVTTSSATGTVDGSGNRIGGLVGFNEAGTIANTSATGTVTSSGEQIGGLVGRNEGPVTTSFATGNVSGTSDIGGLVGENIDSVTNSYWDVNTTHQSNSAGSPGADGLTTSGMTGGAAATNMSGFDFDDAWTTTDSYPHLQWAVESLTLDLNATLDVGNTTRATVTLGLADGSNVTASTVANYSSDTASVATVADNGTVWGNAGGTANVTASLVEQDTALLTVKDDTPPIADAGQNRTVDEDTVLSFDASNSTDNGVIATYEWDFGDGANATGVTPTHTYTRPGTYTVTLTVTDAGGNDATDVLTVTVQAASSDNGGNGGGSGGGGGGPFVDDQFAITLVGGAGSVDLDGDIERLEIAFVDGAAGTVSVEPYAERPTDVDPIQDSAGLAFVEVTVPPSLTDAEATLRLTLDATTLGDVAPADLAVYHYEDGEWTALETSVVSTASGEITVRTTTPVFSLFALGHSARQERPERTESPTTSPSASTASPTTSRTTTPDSVASPTPASSTTESTGQPGFGVGGTVLALLAAMATAVRRRS